MFTLCARRRYGGGCSNSSRNARDTTMTITHKYSLLAAALLAVGMLAAPVAFDQAPANAVQASKAPAAAQAADPLPSWNDGAAKKAIIDFVAKVTKEGSPDFVPVAERIATFDNDCTLWC